MPKLKEDTYEANLDKIYEFVIERNGATMKEIAEHMGWKSQQNTYQYIKALIKLECIYEGVDRQPGKTKDDVKNPKTYFANV